MTSDNVFSDWLTSLAGFSKCAGREMAEKIRQENIQKDKEAMEAMKSEEEEDSPKKVQ
jgi:hypothetical protein